MLRYDGEPAWMAPPKSVSECESLTPLLAWPKSHPLMGMLTDRSRGGGCMPRRNRRRRKKVAGLSSAMWHLCLSSCKHFLWDSGLSEHNSVTSTEISPLLQTASLVRLREQTNRYKSCGAVQDPQVLFSGRESRYATMIGEVKFNIKKAVIAHAYRAWS